MYIKFWAPDATEDDEQISLPAKYAVCSYCRGTGKSSAYLGSFTQEDMYEMGPEFIDDYKNGFYDKECPECKGERVELVPDLQRAATKDIEAYERYLDEEAQYRQLCRMEMSMYGDL